MKVELFRKPSWDRTGDPTIDPTQLDPATGLPVNGKSLQSLSKRHLMTQTEWEQALVWAGLQQAKEAASSIILSDAPAQNEREMTEAEKKAAKAEAFKARMAEARAKKKELKALNK